MNTMYPAHVTLYEDGVYRWSYDMDMRHNTFMRNLLLKVIAVIFAFPVGFFLVMFLARVLPMIVGGPFRRVPRAMMTDMLFPLLITLLIFAGAIGLTMLIYAISALVMHGNYHLCFEMDDSGVALVPSAGVTSFSAVRHVRLYPEQDVINLLEWFGMNQIYASKSDYPFVKNFILAHVREKVRGKDQDSPFEL